MKNDFHNFLINNIREKNYLKNINRVYFDEQKTDENNILDDKALKRRREEIEKYQIDFRHNNLKVLLVNLLDFRGTQIFGIVIPVSLLAATIASFLLPYKKVQTKVYEAYQKESTILSDEEGKIIELGDYYYDTGDLLFDPDFVDAKNNHYAYSLPNDLEYRISNGIDTAIANFDLGENGKLTFNNVDIGKYVDETDYDFSNSTDIDKKYQNLFDDVYELIKSECNLDEYQLAALEDIYNSEDREIIIDMVKFISIGEKEVETVKTRILSRIILVIVSIIYIILELGCILDKGNPMEGYDIDYSDGKLNIKTTKYIKYDILRDSIKIKEGFIRAETERINKVKELALNYLKEEDKDKIFTKFERKLKR